MATARPTVPKTIRAARRHPWNEPNIPGDPLASRAYHAGRLWRNLNWQCQNGACTVAAGDFADKYFSSDYLAQYLNGAGHLPPRWAWHAYEDGYQHTSVKLERFLKATTYKNHAAPGVWLTEQGGRVSTNGDTTKYGLTRAEQDFSYMLTLPNVSSRIRRFYACNAARPSERSTSGAVNRGSRCGSSSLARDPQPSRRRAGTAATTRS